MAEPVLYSFRRCPYAMRARLALLASGTQVEWREIVLRDKPAALLQASPKGTVPVLVLPDGQVLEQSLDIMQWALRGHDPLQWLPPSEERLQEALQWIARCDGEFKHHLDRYKYPHRYQLADGLAHRAQAAVFLLALEHLLKTQPFLHGDHFGLADAAIAPFIRQFAHTDTTWFAAQDWPALHAWLQAFEASELFGICMHKAALWHEGATPTFFPPA
jgi:glutathione S-transferase